MIRRFESPPFNTQFNNDARLRKVRAEELNLLQRQAQPGAVQRVREELRRRVGARTGGLLPL